MSIRRMLLFGVTLFFCNAVSAQVKMSVSQGNVLVNFWLNDKGAPMYDVSFKGRQVILPSSMGFELKQTMLNEALPSIKDGLVILSSSTSSVDSMWSPVWGDTKRIAEKYNQLTINLSQKGDKAIKFNIVFKVFTDGIGFRYEFPKQDNLNHFIVAEEKTQFHLTGDHKAFWIPGDYDSNEFSPNVTNLSEVDAEDPKFAASIFAHQFFDRNAVQTPLMLKTKDGLFINIHEAALVNYPAMDLVIDKSTFTLNSALVPDALGNKAYLQAPAKTPWRTIIVSDKATDILASHTILNLNEPSVIKDPSWIKPAKYVGVWRSEEHMSELQSR